MRAVDASTANGPVWSGRTIVAYVPDTITVSILLLIHVRNVWAIVTKVAQPVAIRIRLIHIPNARAVIIAEQITIVIIVRIGHAAAAGARRGLSNIVRALVSTVRRAV
jgi:hypothetical protein